MNGQRQGMGHAPHSMCARGEGTLLFFCKPGLPPLPSSLLLAPSFQILRIIRTPYPNPPGGGEIPCLGGQESGRPPPTFQAEEVRQCVHLAEHFGNCSEIGGVLRSQLCNPLETKCVHSWNRIGRLSEHCLADEETKAGAWLGSLQSSHPVA